MTANAIRFARTRWILLTIVLLLIVPLIALSIIELHGPQIEHETKVNLEVMARLKAEQVERWLAERIGGGQVIAANSAIIELIAEQQRSASPERLDRIRRWLDAVREGGDYPAAQLIDGKGIVLLALGERHDPPAETMSLLPGALASGKVVHGNITLEKEGGLPALSLVVPLQRTMQGKKRSVGAVILHIHPDHSIFPLILAWPAASASAETLLIRREGESVVFLNQLRHVQNSALKPRRPLVGPSLPAAAAILSSNAGTMRGKDYRGAEVLAAYRPVSGTDWHIVAKIDRDEAMRPLWHLVFWITLVASVALAAVLLALALLWRQQKRAELSQLVRESEARFRAVARTARDAIITADAGGRIVDWNPAAERLFGYSAAEVAGQELTLIIPQRFQKAAMQGFRLMLNGDPERRDGTSAELIVRCKDGQEVLVERAIARWETATGRFCTMTMRDIGPRRREEEYNRRLLAENETILRNALVGIVYLKQRRVVSCNRRFEEILGYGPGELIGESSQRFYESKESFQEIGERAYAALAKKTNYTEEVMLRHKDGHLFPGALNGCAIDPARPNEGSIWIYADISERRQAEQESRKLLQAVEQASVSIIITNRRGIIEYVNPAFTRVTGYSRDEAIGNKPSILKAGATPPSTYRDLWKSISTGKVWQDILLNRRKDGETIWEDTSISPLINDHGEITHYVAVKEDVTERVRVQQQLIDHQAHLEEMVEQRTIELSAALAEARIADQAKDTFLANITHELRTPLSAVIGFSGLARPFCTDPRQREYLDKISSAGKTLSAIIDDLLDLSKIAAGRMTLEASAFSLRQLLARCRSTISFKAEEKGLQLIEHIDNEIPDALLGDPLRLEQILLNLLSNAVKFTTAGQIEMRIGLHSRTAERVCLNIEVQDSGIGMREEALDLLFKPFSQADASMSRKFGGTGLGLVICKRLAKLMDGEIDVSSHEGSGTTFRVRVWLALSDPADLPAAALPADENTLRVCYRDARVLLVDDQVFNREVVEGLLAVVGITPRTASNGQEALDLLLAEGPDAFDLVLMDIQMPVMDGLTATRELRAHGEFDALPIIAMTAHTMTHERKKSHAAGMNDHIGKPFDEAGFYRVLAKWIPCAKQQLSRAEPPLASTAETAVADTRPALRGIDTQAGLALFVGDEARYRYWLSNFTTEAPAFLVQIRQALAGGDAKQARLCAHTLKGRSGMLGMHDLHRVASALETALDDGDPADRLVNRLELAVERACDEIRRLIPITETSPATPASPPLPANRPTGKMPESVQRLLTMLAAGNGDCDAALSQCLDELGNSAWMPRLRAARVEVRNFDFSAARKLLAPDSEAD